MSSNLSCRHRRSAPRALASLLLLTTTACLVGCGHAAKEVARDAMPGGVEGGLASMSQPQNQQRLADVVRGAGMDVVGNDLGRGMVHGVLAEVGLSPSGGQRGPTTAPAGADAARPAAWTIAGGGPEAIQHAAAQTTRVVSREAVLGMRDAMREMGMVDANGHPNVLGDRGRGTLGMGLTLLPLAAGALGLLVIVQAVCIALLLRRMRRDRPAATAPTPRAAAA
jgi:hypothetical protein